MSVYISREDAIKAIDELISSPYAKNSAELFSCGVRDALKLVRDVLNNKCPESWRIPAADVVEVVRCRDCFAFKKSIEFAEAANLNPDEFCGLLLIEMPPDGFCYYGKRRTEDG